MWKNKLPLVSAVFLYAVSAMMFVSFVLLSFFGYSFLYEWCIISSSTCFMNLSLILDPISTSFSAVVCLISGCVMVFSFSYMSHDLFLNRFTWLVLLFVLSMNLFVFIPNLPALLLGWDGLGIISFVLVIYYQNIKSLNAGVLTIMANRVGDVMILISIGLMTLQGHWNIMYGFSSFSIYYLSVLIMVAGMTKSAQIPFSAWLPAAMAAPTPVSALVHSSTLVTAGVFLLIRFYNFFSSYMLFFNSLYIISVLTMFLAGLAANLETDLKKIIALSTLSQLGVMMMSLSLKMPYLALFHLYTHALFKALLFLCAGTIIYKGSDIQDIRYMGGLYKDLPLVTICMNIANLSLCGSPFLSGFYSKDLILEVSLFNNHSWLTVLVCFLATWMTALYSIRVSLSSIWSSWKTLPFELKYNNVFTNSSIMILSVFAIFCGMSLQVVMPMFYPIFLLPYSLKQVPVMLLVSGVLVMMVFWFSLHEHTPRKLKAFFTNMWFLSYISSQPLSELLLVTSSNILKSLEYGWLEKAGEYGLFFTIETLINYSENLQAKNFNFFISAILFSLLIFYLYAVL